MRTPARLLTLAALLLVAPPPLFAGSATLTWNANPEPDIAGYTVVYGTRSGVYAFTQQVGNVTTTSITNLEPGQTYYFAVRAVNQDGLTSPGSLEVSAYVPYTSPTGETLDHWKARFGITDMNADPDGDGVINLDEFLGGTDPFISNTWLLAEGLTGAFRTRLALANPGTDPAEITIRFLPQGGTPIVQQYSVPAESRRTIVLNDIAGLQDVAVAAEVTTQRGGVLVERTVTWGGPEATDSAHTGRAVESAQTAWYFAEGDTTVFDAYLSLVNPNPMEVNASVTFYLAGGQTLQTTYALPADRRQSISLNAVPGLGQTSFGMLVRATAPIAAERTMYFNTKDTVWKGGHASPGVEAPSNTWYLAEGQTGSVFSEYLLFSNPNAVAATATVQFITSAGARLAKSYIIAPTSRLTVAVNDIIGLENAEVSAVVASTLPIVVERSMYWPGQWGQWYEGHASAAMASLGTKWVLAEGETGGAHNAVSRFLLANPNPVDAAVKLTLLRDNGRAPVTVQATVVAGTRMTLDSSEFPLLSGEQFGAVVESTNGVGFVVERSMYWDGQGRPWSAGTTETGALIRAAQPIRPAGAEGAGGAAPGPRPRQRSAVTTIQEK